MRLIKEKIKNVLGFSKFLLSRAYKPGQASILMYHSVGNNEAFFTVKPEEFNKQIEFLVRNKYNIISLQNLAQTLKNEKNIKKKTIILTFDDGYKDNYINVFPILKKYDLPATIFIATDYVGKTMKNSKGVEISMLNWAEITDMSKSGLVEFGCHTASHRKLDLLVEEEIVREFSSSQNLIKEKLGKACDLLAYPYGKYNEKVLASAKEFFSAGVTVAEGNIGKRADILRLPMLAITSRRTWGQFLGKISGR